MNTPLRTGEQLKAPAKIEECYNLAPVIKSLRDNADLLNAFFIYNEK